VKSKPVALVTTLALLCSLVVPAVALGHARVSPAVALAGELQLFSLAVPTEKSGVTTSKIVLTGSGDNAIVERVTWTGGHTPTGEDSLFQFLAQPAAAQTYTFQVQQTYSDGSIVNWSGSESSAAPAPTISAKSSLGGGGGTSVLTIIALVVGVLGLATGAFALVGGTGSGTNGGQRPLA